MIVTAMAGTAPRRPALARMPKQSDFHKRSAGTAGKKPPVPSFKPDAFRTLVEILKRRKPRRADDAESGGRGEAVEAQAPFAKRYEEVRRGEVMGWSPRWGNLSKNVVSRQRRIALELLASNAQGAPEALLLVHGFTRPNAIANSRKPGERPPAGRTPISRARA
jgi:hypothetical protein